MPMPGSGPREVKADRERSERCGNRPGRYLVDDGPDRPDAGRHLQGLLHGRAHPVVEHSDLMQHPVERFDPDRPRGIAGQGQQQQSTRWTRQGSAHPHEQDKPGRGDHHSGDQPGKGWGSIPADRTGLPRRSWRLVTSSMLINRPATPTSSHARRRALSGSWTRAAKAQNATRSSNAAFHHAGKLASPFMFRKLRGREIEATYSWNHRTKTNAATTTAVTTPRATTTSRAVGDHRPRNGTSGEYVTVRPNAGGSRNLRAMGGVLCVTSSDGPGIGRWLQSRPRTDLAEPRLPSQPPVPRTARRSPRRAGRTRR